MKSLFLTVLAATIFYFPSFSQVDPALRADVRNTGYMHSPLPMDQCRLVKQK